MRRIFRRKHALLYMRGACETYGANGRVFARPEALVGYLNVCRQFPAFEAFECAIGQDAHQLHGICLKPTTVHNWSAYRDVSSQYCPCFTLVDWLQRAKRYFVWCSSQRMGCLRMIFGVFLAPFRRARKAQDFANHAFDESICTDISDSQEVSGRARKSRSLESESSSRGEKERRHKRRNAVGERGRRRRVSPRDAKEQKKKRESGSGLLGEENPSSISESLLDRERRNQGRKHRGGSDMDSGCGARSGRRHRDKNIEKSAAIGVSDPKSSGNDVECKRNSRSPRLYERGRGDSAFDREMDDACTNYTFIIDNYINNAVNPRGRSVCVKKDYNVLLKNKMHEYIDRVSAKRGQT